VLAMMKYFSSTVGVSLVPVGGNPVKVCKKFFLAILGISETFANHAFKNQQGGVYVGEDRRGRHAPHNKTTKTVLDILRFHS
jgi:capsule polysaccharide modification protein KpsS